MCNTSLKKLPTDVDPRVLKLPCDGAPPFAFGGNYDHDPETCRDKGRWLDEITFKREWVFVDAFKHDGFAPCYMGCGVAHKRACVLRHPATGQTIEVGHHCGAHLMVNEAAGVSFDSAKEFLEEKLNEAEHNAKEWQEMRLSAQEFREYLSDRMEAHDARLSAIEAAHEKRKDEDFEAFRRDITAQKKKLDAQFQDAVAAGIQKHLSSWNLLNKIPVGDPRHSWSRKEHGGDPLRYFPGGYAALQVRHIAPGHGEYNVFVKNQGTKKYTTITVGTSAIFTQLSDLLYEADAASRAWLRGEEYTPTTGNAD